MADFTALKTAIQNAIKQNGNEEITGNLLQDVLLAIVTTLGDGSINDLITALGSEATTRSQADGTLQQNIDAEATTRGQADTTLQQNIDAEAQARLLADSTLQGGINTAMQAINAINNAITNGCVYAGIATPSSTPASGKVFYLALTAGTYTNYGGLEVPQGINILKNNGSTWLLDSFLGIDDAPTQGSANLVKSGGVLNSIIQNGPAFDLSAYNAEGGTLATYADLSAALTALNALPADFKKGGMSFKFVLSSDNNYVQFRYMGTATTGSPNPFLDTANWQGVDNELVKESKNLATSGAGFNLKRFTGLLEDYLDELTLTINTENAFVYKNGTVVEFNQFNIYNAIFLSKGEIIFVFTNAYRDNISVVSLSTENNSNYLPLLISHVNGDWDDNFYGFMVPQDGYYAISGKGVKVYKVIDNVKGLLSILPQMLTILNGNIQNEKELLLRYLDIYHSNEVTYTLLETNGFIHKNGSFYENNDYSTTTEIAINAYDLLIVEAYEHANNISVISEVVDENSYSPLVVSTQDLISIAKNTYMYIAEKDMNIAVTFNNKNPFSLKKVSLENAHNILGFILNFYRKLQEEIDFLNIENNKDILEKATALSLTSESGYFIYKDGTKVEFETGNVSNPVLLNGGDLIIMDLIGYSNSVSFLSICDENGENRIPVVVSAYSYRTYNREFNLYCVPKTQYYIFSYLKKNEQYNISYIQKNYVPFEYKIIKYKNEVDNTPQLYDNPLDVISGNLSLTASIPTWGFIGDSLASGTVEAFEGATKTYEECYTLSWGQILCRMLGIEGYNFSRGGETAIKWCTSTYNPDREWIGAQSNLKTAYIIALGVNDYNRPEFYGKSTPADALGNTSTDIDYDNYNNNAVSFVGYYAGIIQRIRSVQPRAYIFCVTVPRTYFSAYNSAIREICNLFNNVYCIDLASMTSEINSMRFRDIYFMNGHMTIAGYTYIALLMNTYIDWIIRQNGIDFKDIGLSNPAFTDSYGRTTNATYNLSGTVTRNGSPITNAKIISFAGNKPFTALTDSNGDFTVTAGIGHIEIIENGARIYNEPISITENTSSYVIDI